MKIPNTDLISLFASRPSPADNDLNLAARYAPILRFDAREPFLPLAVGYSIFKKNAHSPSFPRRLDLKAADLPGVELAIEYAIWWDWDIVHLYELEHIWVFLDKHGKIIRGEASGHGDCNDLRVSDTFPLLNERLTLFSEPGKHAFAPMAAELQDKAESTRHLCRQMAGTGGLLITQLFKEFTSLKTLEMDQLIYAYLQSRAFEPSFEFSRSFSITADMLVPWPALFRWIPERIAWLIDNLKQTLLYI